MSSSERVTLQVSPPLLKAMKADVQVPCGVFSLGNPEFCPKKIGSCCCSLIIESALPAGTTVLIPLCWWEQTNPVFSQLRKRLGMALVEVLGKIERKRQASI